MRILDFQSFPIQIIEILLKFDGHLKKYQGNYSITYTRFKSIDCSAKYVHMLRIYYSFDPSMKSLEKLLTNDYNFVKICSETVVPSFQEQTNYVTIEIRATFIHKT